MHHKKPEKIKQPEKRLLDAGENSQALSLADLITNPSKTVDVPTEAVPPLLGEIECLRAKLWARMMTLPTRGPGYALTTEDRLLTARQAAQRLGMSTDYLYRHADELPFTVRVSPGQLRFSSQGIQRYIHQRLGR